VAAVRDGLDLGPQPIQFAELISSISETAALLDVSPADIVDLACRRRAPLPTTHDERGAIGFYRSEVDCWVAEHGASAKQAGLASSLLALGRTSGAAPLRC
jgi:predicted DNA-binding transcriptional regulator AlpA